MSNKEELEKLEEEIRLQELKIKKNSQTPYEETDVNSIC